MDGSLVEDLTGGNGKIQTRDADGALRYFDSVREAFDYAKMYSKVWKVSWYRELPDGKSENLRFIRKHLPKSVVWEFESADEIVEKAIKDAQK